MTELKTLGYIARVGLFRHGHNTNGSYGAQDWQNRGDTLLWIVRFGIARPMNSSALEKTAAALVADGKGILAADESFPTIEKRFKKLSIPSTDETRRSYREMLLSAPELGRFISGVILFDETIRQKTAGGQPIPQLLRDKGIIPGIKVDQGTIGLPGFSEEKITQGLDGLPARLKEYSDLGARFAKWRAVIGIAKDRPSDACLEANAHALARYAGICQEAGLLPIVEPEVLMDGDHSIDRCFEVTERTLRAVFNQLAVYGVSFEGMLLKPNMVLAGEDAPDQAPPQTVAEYTLRCLRHTVPASVPGIVFLSGGQSDELATIHLNLMNRINRVPWALSFSYGRALQDAAMKAWHGSAEAVAAGQKALAHRARCNSAARAGSYEPGMEAAA